MTLASLLVAILALVVAAASAIYTRRQAIYTKRQATASEGALAIERSRHLEERCPRLSGRVERFVTRTRGPVTELKVTLESNEPLAAMELDILAGQGVTFGRDVHGVHAVEPGDVALRGFSYGPGGEPAGMQPRRSMTWEVNLSKGHVVTLQMEATCHGLAGERWASVMIAAPIESRRQ
jgi:hypothetical protein